MPLQQVPQGLWNRLFQQPPQPTPDQSLMQMMFEKQKQQQDPRLFMREINPGTTWGGKDQNAVQPNDLMQMYFSPTPSANS